MQLQFPNFPNCCLFRYSSYLSVDYFHIQVVRLQAPPFPKSMENSAFGRRAKKIVGCRANKIPGKKNGTFG